MQLYYIGLKLSGKGLKNEQDDLGKYSTLVKIVEMLWTSRSKRVLDILSAKIG